MAIAYHEQMQFYNQNLRMQKFDSTEFLNVRVFADMSQTLLPLHCSADIEPLPRPSSIALCSSFPIVGDRLIPPQPESGGSPANLLQLNITTNIHGM
jgi:hypothetical protein